MIVDVFPSETNKSCLQFIVQKDGLTSVLSYLSEIAAEVAEYNEKRGVHDVAMLWEKASECISVAQQKIVDETDSFVGH